MITTARKLEENIQDVPIAISAFSKEEMTRRSMQELEDVALGTAGFSFEDYGGGFGVPVIRGGSQIRIQDLDQTTSVYLDGIYLPRQYMVDFGTVGFDRIEIVKGPQSALFGRNAFLGAVNYISGGPGDEFDAEVRGTVGSDERYDLYAEVSGPIVGDRIGARALVAYSEFDGTWSNQNPNYDGRDYGKRGTTDNLGGWENRTIGVNLEANPVDPFTIEFDYYNVERFQETMPSVRVEVNNALLGIQGFPDTNCSPTFGANNDNRFYCGEIPQTFAPIQPLDPNSGTPAAPGTETVVDPRSFLLNVETDFAHVGAAWEFN
ncbi:MAG: TonB-dependent receptor plug domain-containing protein, partial [Gammaproteobacteria bacterium]|nr:TonB-dependent receptor plug domain-containing protein [Gammaproteobacteria bacterium]